MPLASDALRIARAGIRAVAPRPAVRRTLVLRRGSAYLGGHALPTGPGGRVVVLAIGKAAAAMADAATGVLGPDVEGLVVTPRGYPRPGGGLPVRYGEHPVPGPGSYRAGRELLRVAAATEPRDVAVFLISGGGSAAAEAPAPGLSPVDLTSTTERLLSSGAPIGAMNAIRRHLSAIKGGQLARATVAGRFGTVAISDVVGDPAEDIASGPTVGDPSTYADALRGIRRYQLGARLRPRVLEHLRRGRAGAIAETPKPADRRFRGAPFQVAASNRTAQLAAGAAARRLGYQLRVAARPVVGETQPAARRFAAALVRTPPGRAGRLALIGGGETTVTLGPRPGRGGRNQEFALAASAILRGLPALVLSIGTDGIDGPTDAAGGWVDGRTYARARAARIDLGEVLLRHAAYDALRALGGLVVTGPTGTNVTDLHVGLRITSVRRGTARSSPPSAAPSSRRRPS